MPTSTPAISARLRHPLPLHLEDERYCRACRSVPGCKRPVRGRHCSLIPLTNSQPPTGTYLNAIPLMWYSMARPLAEHHPANSWTGGPWLELRSKQSCVVIGCKATGPLYYGEARPGDCSDSKGYHGPPDEVQAVFYSASELLQTAEGQRHAFDIEPRCIAGPLIRPEVGCASTYF